MVNRRGWRRVLGVLAANEVAKGPYRVTAYACSHRYPGAKRLAHKWYQALTGKPL
jgi:hypothetical protein